MHTTWYPKPAIPTTGCNKVTAVGSVGPSWQVCKIGRVTPIPVRKIDAASPRDTGLFGPTTEPSTLSMAAYLVLLPGGVYSKIPGWARSTGTLSRALLELLLLTSTRAVDGTPKSKGT